MTYYDWCCCIGTYLFNSEKAGREISLDLDRDELLAASKAYLGAREADIPEESVRWKSFLQALRDGPIASGDSSASIIYRAGKACQLWQKELSQGSTSGAAQSSVVSPFPLHLPYLVALVLPYSDSTSDQELTTNSYYQRVSAWLNESGLYSGRFSTDAIRTALPRGMPSWQELWDSVALWSSEREQGKRGIFRARRHGELRYVSLPLGQCLFPPRLRRALRQHFAEQPDADQRSSYSRERVLTLLREASNQGLPFPAPTSQSLWSPGSELCETIISRTEELLNIPVRAAPQLGGAVYSALKERSEPLTLFLSDHMATGVVSWYFRISSTRQPLPESLTLHMAGSETEITSQSRVWSGRIVGKDWAPIEIRVPSLDSTYRLEPCDTHLFAAATSCYGLPDWVETSDWQSLSSLRLLAKASRQAEVQAWGATQAKDLRQLPRQGLPSGYALFSLSSLLSPPPGILPSRARAKGSQDPLVVVEGGLAFGAGSFLYSGCPDLLPVLRLSPQAVLSGQTPYVKYLDGERADLWPNDEDSSLWHLPQGVCADRRLCIFLGSSPGARPITLTTPVLPAQLTAVSYRADAYDDPASEQASAWITGAYVDGQEAPRSMSRSDGAVYEQTKLSIALSILYDRRARQRTQRSGEINPRATPAIDVQRDQSDALLYFLSHRQRTSSVRFAAVFNGIAAASGQPTPSQEDLSQCRLLLAHLGHAVRQADGTVLALPPTLVSLPAMSSGWRALLVGSRSPHLLRQLSESARRWSVGVSRVPQHSSTKRLLLPDALILETLDMPAPVSSARTKLRSFESLASVAAPKADPGGQLRQIAKECGIVYREEPTALTLALFGGHGIADYEQRLLSAEEDDGYYEGFLQRRFNPHLIRWETTPTGSPLQKGLFSLRHNSPIRGRFDVRWIMAREGRQIRVDPSWGRYLELKHASTRAWRYCGQTSQLAIPASAPLPSLPARALTLLSGLAPELKLLDRDGQPRYYHIYRAVPATMLKYYLEPTLGQQALFDSQFFLS